MKSRILLLFFSSNAGIWKTFNRVFIWILTGEVLWNVGGHRRCTFFQIFLWTLWFCDFSPDKEFLYWQLRSSDVWGWCAVGGYDIFEENILVCSEWRKFNRLGGMKDFVRLCYCMNERFIYSLLLYETVFLNFYN